MSNWDITEHEGESPHNSQTGRKGIGSCLSGLRYGQELSKLVLDAGVLYANADVTELVTYHRPLTAALNTWTDAEGNLVKPKLLGETRGSLYGNGLCPEIRG